MREDVGIDDAAERHHRLGIEHLAEHLGKNRQQLFGVAGHLVPARAEIVQPVGIDLLPDRDREQPVADQSIGAEPDALGGKGFHRTADRCRDGDIARILVAVGQQEHAGTLGLAAGIQGGTDRGKAGDQRVPDRRAALR